MAAAQTDTALIKNYFAMDLPTAKRELTGQGLTAEDKRQLGEGIRNGSLTYTDREAEAA